jgi:K+:H+ antiporter
MWNSARPAAWLFFQASMTDLYFLRELIIVLAATLAIVFVCQKLRLPTIVGFLFAGVAIGPHGLGLIKSLTEVESLAEIGVILLLFSIGLEFSLEELFSVQKRIIVAGLLQVVLTIAVAVGIGMVFGFTLEAGLFYGFLAALSSTAIVLRIFKDRNEINSIQGQLATGVLLLQDLCVVPMILLVPVLGHADEGALWEVLWALVKAVVALALIVWSARKLLPRLLRQVALVRDREIFLLFVVLACLGTAWLTSEFGLSLALGALVAGMVISESELSHQIVADILPLRHCFSGIFFISIGMLLDLEYLSRAPSAAALQLILMVGVKILVIVAVFGALYRSLRLGIVLGISLGQIGEFSFILAKTGITYNLLSPAEEQTFLATSILSMMATPLLIQCSQSIAFGLDSAVQKARDTSRAESTAAVDQPAQGHVVVVGYGLNGQNLARVLKEVGIPYRVLEMNPDLVYAAASSGEPVSFGDATRREILQAAGISGARVIVVAISDPVATARIVSTARSLRPDLFVIVRTRYVAEIDSLYRLGADQVIPEEFETSVEIFAQVLQKFHVPRNVIMLQVELIRREHYGTLRGLRFQGEKLDALNQFLVGTTTDIFSILEDSPATGKTLTEVELRARSGATVIAVVRDGKSHHKIGGDFTLAAGDMLVLLGSHKALDEAGQLLNPARDPVDQ